MTAVMERMLLQEVATGRRFRVVDVNPLLTTLMPIGEKGKWEETDHTKDVNARLRSGSYVEVEHEATREDSCTANTEHALENAKRFENTFSDKRRMLTKKGRGQLFREMKVDDPELSKATFYRVARDWLEGACTTIALAGKRKATKVALDTSNLEAMSLAEATKTAQAQALKHLDAGKPERKKTDHRQDGRARQRRQALNPTRYAVDRATLRVFKYYYEQANQSAGSTLPGTFETMRRAVFSSTSPLGDITIWPDWCTPTLNQFREWYYTLTSRRARRVRIRGAHHYDLNERARPGQGVSAAYTAGAVASADATIFDVELVSDLPGAALIGPPVVFRIRCKDTGELLGLGVSLENASWMGMASAIANCAEDKVAMCAEYGIPITPDAWNVRGIPAAIEADCGETDNSKPHRFVHYTACELRNLPKARPDLKPGVESDFNTLRVRLCEKTPGAIIKAFEDLTQNQFRLRARMTLKAFIKMLLLEELKRMHTPRAGLVLPTQMIADGVDSSPAAMFDWCVENGAGGMRKFPIDQVKLSLLDIDTATITDAGLEFKNILYMAPELDIAEALAQARRERRRALRVAYDPRLANHIYIVHGNELSPAKYTKAELNRRRPDQRDFWNKSYREADEMRAKQLENNSARKNSVKDQMAMWSKMQEDLVTESNIRVAQERADHGQSRASLIRGRPAARLVEKNSTSPGMALVPNVPTPVASAEAPTSNVAPLVSPPKRRSGFAAAASRLVPQQATTENKAAAND